MMEDKNSVSCFRVAARIIEIQRRVLQEAHAEPGIIDALGAIIKHLNSLSAASVLKIIGGREHREMLRNAKEREASSAASMSLDAVERALADEKITRTLLEAIAVGRFHVPKGSLRSLGNVEQLRDKIATLARNERAHETISLVAKDTGS